MWAEVRFAFLSEEEKRRLVCVALPESRQTCEVAAGQTGQTGFLECEHPFIDEPMLRTKPPVASVRLLCLGSKLYPS